MLYESGVMTATVRVNGASISAQVRVNIKDCPLVGDSTLDSPEARKQLFDELAASNPDESPESMRRKEHGGFIYQRLDGSRTIVPVSGTSITSQCAYLPDFQSVPAVDPTWTKVGEYHSHPSLKGDPAYGCVDVPGEAHNKQFPGDVGVLPLVGDDGPSGDRGDWMYAKHYTVTDYIADKAGNVWRINYPPGATPESNVSNRWRRQKGSVCLKVP